MNKMIDHKSLHTVLGRIGVLFNTSKIEFDILGEETYAIFVKAPNVKLVGVKFSSEDFNSLCEELGMTGSITFYSEHETWFTMSPKAKQKQPTSVNNPVVEKTVNSPKSEKGTDERFFLMNDCYEFVEVSKKDFIRPPDGFINNWFVWRSEQDGSDFFDFQCVNVNAGSLRQLLKLVKFKI